MSAEGGTKSIVEKAIDRTKEKRHTLLQEDAQLVEKPPLLTRLWNGVVHTVTGFKLLAIDVRLSTKLLMKSLRGQQLTRRESKLVSSLMIS